MRPAHPGTSEWWRAERPVADGDAPRASVVEAAGATESPVPFWSLMAFTFILLLAPQQAVPALAPYRIALLTGAVAVITYVYDRLRRRLPIVRLTWEMWIILYLVGWAFLTVPFSYWPTGSLSFLVGNYLKTLAIFWLLSHTVTTITRMRQVAWGLSLMSVPLAASAVDNYLSGVFIATEGVKRIVGYDAPLTKNPNDLALMINLILPLSVALFLGARKPLVRTVLLAIIVLDIGAVIITFSRGGFLTLATICVIYLWRLFKQPEPGWAVGALVIGLACIMMVPSGYWDRLYTITDIGSDPTGSAQERLRDMVSAVRFVSENPIMGAGVGMNVLALNEARGVFWMEVHNVYLEFTTDLGIPGLVLFLLLLVSCIKAARFVQHGSVGVLASRELFYLAKGVEISLIAFAVAALFYPVAFHFYFYYIAGMAMAVRAVYEAESSKAPIDQNRASPKGLEITAIRQIEKSGVGLEGKV
jgi:putative inorganic carbon (HCO3(-)) transporter